MEFLMQFENITRTLHIIGCHFSSKKEAYAYPKHHHYLYELQYCMGGESIIEVNGEEVKLTQGDCILLNPRVNHSQRNSSRGDLMFFVLHFDLDDKDFRHRLGGVPYHFIAADMANESLLPQHIGKLEYLLAESLVQDTHRQDHREEHSSQDSHISLTLEQRLRLQIYVLHIIREILHITVASAATKLVQPAEITGYENELAHAAEALLMADFYTSPKIQDIAQELNVSRSQVSKIFSKVYGMSPQQYLTRAKLNRAKELLGTSNLMIREIAEFLGFQTLQHFSRQFRRWTGKSPNEYRRSGLE